MSKLSIVPYAAFDPYAHTPPEGCTDDVWEDYLADCAVYFKGRFREFVQWAFDWGHGILDHDTGMDDWQSLFGMRLEDEVADRAFDGSTPTDPIFMAVGSGHGVGKSAVVAWLILWILFTRPMARGIITAGTVNQLLTKTVPELKLWHGRFIAKHWFIVDSLKIYHVDKPANWRADFLTATKENSEAFAGLHAKHSCPFFIFDESSGVDDGIYDVALGGLTDGEAMFFKFGNRTKKHGHFNKCWTDPIEKRNWITQVVDSRKAKTTNKKLLNKWIADWGIDSDWCRVRILGLDPKQGSEAYFDSEKIQAARTMPALTRMGAPLVLGVDVARFGDDRSVIFFRKGRDGRTHPPLVFKGHSTTQLAQEVARINEEMSPQIIFVDGGGVGGGVVDQLREVHFLENVVEVNFGSSAAQPLKYYNKRTEMYGRLRDEIHEGRLAIPDTDDLGIDLLAQQYFIDPRRRVERLVSKEDLKKIGEYESPDLSDAAALTYAFTTLQIVDFAGGQAGGSVQAEERKPWHTFDDLDQYEENLHAVPLYATLLPGEHHSCAAHRTYRSRTQNPCSPWLTPRMWGVNGRRGDLKAGRASTRPSWATAHSRRASASQEPRRLGRQSGYLGSN